MTVFMFLNMLFLFSIKMIDNILSTAKTILIQKNKALFAALLVFLSQVIFYKLVVAVNQSGDIFTILLISLAGSLGTFLAIKFNNKFSKDRLYVNVILSDNKKAMEELREYLMAHKITNFTTDVYTKEWNKTLGIIAYVETKDESKLLDDYLNKSKNKFKRVITKN